jgi:hypothetical protein
MKDLIRWCIVHPAEATALLTALGTCLETLRRLALGFFAHKKLSEVMTSAIEAVNSPEQKKAVAMIMESKGTSIIGRLAQAELDKLTQRFDEVKK